jgi:hypothetical protein
LKYIPLLALAASAVIAAAPASAAPRTAAEVVAENGVYFWIDGRYERLKLPTYSLGFRNTGFLVHVDDRGPAQIFNPRLDGGGVRGAIGYRLPGTNTRIEFGGSYLDASTTESQTTSPGPGLLVQFMSGAFGAGAFNCIGAPISTCSATGRLDTDYSAWQFNGKAETDWRYGSVTVTPFVAVFGGNTRADQALSQSLTQVSIAGGQVHTADYSVITRLQWRDLGARAGLNLNTSVTPAFIVGIGGAVGVATRRVSLSGNDVGSPSLLVPHTASSALSLSNSKAVLLANAEASFTYRLAQMMALRGFVGLNFDSDVPGIAGPSFQIAALRSASITYANEMSFYAGGGLVVTFGGPSATR